MDNDDLDLNLDDSQDNINRGNQRNKQLADKVITTSKERDDALEKANKAEQDRINSEKERDFYKNFNQVSSKYAGASEYQDKILEKVNAGYDLEDATISILAKEGKYTPTQPTIERESAAGGSADIGMTAGSDKTPDKMSQDERRNQLLDLEAKGEFHL